MLKIISGGQTGADRAGLDVAIALGLEYGGSLPKGRMTEDGPLDLKYKSMTELDIDSYSMRTEKNVKDSDVTLIFVDGPAGEGTVFTIELCKKLNKPYLLINFTHDKDYINMITGWIKTIKPGVLNIAGSRESGAPGIYDKTYRVLYKALKML
ncbi:MAG: putative molybdenum carrier protein [bacterium]